MPGDKAADIVAYAADRAVGRVDVLVNAAGNTDRVAEFSKVECRDKFAVIADPGAKIAKSYHATNIATDLKGWSDRTSYVIGADGKVKFAYSNFNPDKHVELTLAEVKKLKAK